MFTIANLLISTAFAQDAGAPVVDAAVAPTGPLGGVVSPQILMVLALFAVWFFLVIRPQNKKVQEQEKMIKALQRGDRIVTSGGIHGKIAKLEGDDILIVEIADNVQIKMARAHVLGLEAKTQPVVTAEK